jgi:3-oxoadipate enol-lactonase
MDTRSGFVEVKGGKLYYEVSGSGSPVLLLSGFSLDTRMWDDQFEVFAKHHRVVRFDTRGHGQSPASLEPYRRVQDIGVVLDVLDMAKAHLVGLSLGGSDAIDFVLEAPSRVNSLTAVDAGLSGFRWTINWDSGASTMGLDAAKENWLAHPMFAALNRNPELSARMRKIVNDYSGWHWLNRDPELGIAPPAIQRLSDIRTPTLVLVGERDLPDFHAVANLLGEKIPGARKLILAEAGHMANMEDPDLLNKLVLDFIDSVDSVSNT